MDQGSIMEQQAIPWFEFSRNVTVQRVGFITSDDGKMGCSPDGLIGEDEGLEIKSPQSPKHIQYLLAGVVPPDYLPQIHMSMYITGRKAWWFASYNSYLPKLLIRVERDEEIQAKLRDALTAFVANLDAHQERLNALLPHSNGR